jgi:ATP-dependent exoDNAse (exonuclease V) alpha subunit
MLLMNEKQKEALSIVKNGYNLFLTGSAGTGKSYTLKGIIQYLENTNKKYGLTALTGCAAVLINGQTIHSFLYLGISRNLDEIYNKLCKYKGKLNDLKKLDVLIIDEISMMDYELFELINKLLMRIKNNDKYFGGVQMILVGDFFQLPPINGDYCFTSSTWENINLKKIILTELIRQKDDDKLKEILEEIRNGNISDETINILSNLKNKEFANKEIKPTRLYPININVDKINNYEFKKLVKINKGVINTYKAFSNKPTAEKIDNYDITLTLNAQVMVIRNLSIDNKLFNGTRGIVIEMKENSVIIKDINDNYHEINYYTDINNNNKKYKISFIPLKLAYAMSIHKAQGASIDYLELDLGENIFISGQLYTALSRATNINNIKLIDFSKSSFMQNEKVKKFYDF